jgi:iron complex transport system substrate-binding protein
MLPGVRRFGPSAALIVFAALAAARGARAQGVAPRPEPTAGPVAEVTDEIGRRVRVPQPVRRIVSLAPSLTETIYALGAQDRLVGDTDYCDYPPEAQTKPKVGGIVNPNLEQVVVLKPDLVLVAKSINRRETLEALDRLGLAAYVTDPHTVEEVLDSTARLAEVIGAREAGEAVATRLRARLAELKRRLDPRPLRRVLFVVWHDPLISVGRGTFLFDALRWAGGESVIDTAQEWPHVSLEEVARLQPDYLVFSSAQREDAERDFQALRDRPGWRSLDAVQQGRMVVVSDAINHPSPRLVDAIFELVRQLHPDAFTEKPENEKQKTKNGKEAPAEERSPFSNFRFLAASSPGHRSIPPGHGWMASVEKEAVPCGR